MPEKGNEILSPREKRLEEEISGMFDELVPPIVENLKAQQALLPKLTELIERELTKEGDLDRLKKLVPLLNSLSAEQHKILARSSLGSPVKRQETKLSGQINHTKTVVHTNLRELLAAKRGTLSPADDAEVVDVEAEEIDDDA